MVDACKRSNAKTITVILANYPYARQDKKDRPRTPISAKVVADLLECVGMTRLLVIDLHANQIQGFFNVPVDNLFTRNLVIEHLNYTVFKDLSEEELQEKFILVSPDAGGMKRVAKMADLLKLKSIAMHKVRDHSKKSKVDRTILIGDEFIENRTCIIIDDMTDTMGTVCKACETLVQSGAKDVIVIVTHGILSGPGVNRLNNCECISRLITSDTLPQKSHLKQSNKISVFYVSNLLATCIDRILNNGSISELYN